MSNSSAINMGKAFFMPWPVSGFLAMTSNVLLGLIVIKTFALGAAAGPAGPPRGACSRVSAAVPVYIPIITPPPARVLILKNERRSSCFIFIGAPLLRCAVGGEFNGITDSQIRSATADILRHRGVDLGVCGFRCFREESCGLHD